MLDAGSYLQAYQTIDTLRRDPQGMSAADLDTLSARAVEALSAAFKKSITDKSYDDALRLFDSARAIGRLELAGPWTEKSLLGELAAAQEGRGDTVLALLTRLHMLGGGGALRGGLRRGAFRRRVDRKSYGHQVPRRLDEVHGFTVPADGGRRIGGGALVPEDDLRDGDDPRRPGDQGAEWGGVSRPGHWQRIFHRQAGLPPHESPRDRERGGPEVQGLFAPLPPSVRKPRRREDSRAGGRVRQDLRPCADQDRGDASLHFRRPGNQVPVPGDRIYAIGSPVGLEKTLSTGIVSAMGRRLLQVGDSMQVDVLVNPGNSGGPLLSANGDLVGIVFAGLQQFAGLNFAVPYAWVEKALPALYRGGQAIHPWLGMALAETDKGLEVIYCVPDEPAARAGIALR